MEFFKKYCFLSLRSGSASHRRRHQDHAVPADEQHRDVSLGRLVDLFVGLLVDLDVGHRFLDISQDHVQVLIVSLTETKVSQMKK